MIWQDILLERQFENEVLKRALAEAFDVPFHDIRVVDSIEEASEVASIIAEQTSIKGDFRCLLSLYVDDSLASMEPAKVTRKLCSLLNVQALISDDSVNPYTMILINAATEGQSVKLDAESLDEYEEYRLSKDISGYE